MFLLLNLKSIYLLRGCCENFFWIVLASALLLYQQDSVSDDTTWSGTTSNDMTLDGNWNNPVPTGTKTAFCLFKT